MGAEPRLQAFRRGGVSAVRAAGPRPPSGPPPRPPRPAPARRKAAQAPFSPSVRPASAQAVTGSGRDPRSPRPRITSEVRPRSRLAASPGSPPDGRDGSPAHRARSAGRAPTAAAARRRRSSRPAASTCGSRLISAVTAAAERDHQGGGAAALEHVPSGQPDARGGDRERGAGHLRRGRRIDPLGASQGQVGPTARAASGPAGGGGGLGRRRPVRRG